jgi:hypothetical protein
MTFDDLLASLWLTGGLFVISAAMQIVIIIATYLYAALRDRLSSYGWPERDLALTAVWIALPIGLAGMVAGYLTGLSRAPAAGNLVPAVLALVSAVALAFIGKTREHAWAVAFSIIAFSLNILLGTTMGATARDNHLALLQSPDYQKKLAAHEYMIRNYRKALGLPENPFFGISKDGD